MSFPTPTIYTYRVSQYLPANAHPSVASVYIAEFSTNSGSTWNWLTGTPFQSLTEAYQAIALIVSNEAQFQTQYLNVSKFNNPQTVPVKTNHAYPPA